MRELLQHRLMRRFAGHSALEQITARTLGLFRPAAPLPRYRPAGYFPNENRVLGENDAIFITARFRSGSTLLWQAFDRLAGFTAYYEPLNERRWFDPSTRGEGTDETHRGVQNYYNNYNDLEHMSELFSTKWTYQNLAMGHSAHSSALEKYVAALISHAAERPVLQFNRVDFRLPFLRAKFPDASILHLRRNPRDSWRSTLKGATNDRDWNLITYSDYCHFYLLPWYRDLAISYPWLLADARKTHPYRVHYLLSRFSDLFAAEWAHTSISYEALCADFAGTIGYLLMENGHTHSAQKSQKGTPIVPKVCPFDLSPLEGLMAPRQEGYDHSVDADFYTAEEAAAEALLKAHLPNPDQD
ncbi:sulfotransferase [Kordiimonas lacus]|uniref:Sulfotransferase family protein n=1 Tax=Kordiimonas lacus TaxID=637679 RepID=A0A1G7CAV0_9PROT|nr:sulfotransferase [Kordiimonas lacus]SDE36512.1 Sulfotransferase family protein [Kordiimonas lacus]